MRLSFALAVFAALCSGISPALAGAQAVSQSSSTQPTTAVQEPAFSAEQKTSAQYYKLMLDMAEASQALSLSDQQKLHDNLIVIYERLIELYCMPDLLRSLEYRGDPQQPDCLRYIEKLTTLHPDNPVLLCAKHGIDSSLCRDAWAAQYIDAYSLEDLDISELDLKTKIRAETTEKDASALASEVSELQSRYKTMREGAAPLPELTKMKRQVDATYTKLLNLSCKIVRIKITREPVDSSKQISTLAKHEPRKEHPLDEYVRNFTNTALPKDSKKITWQQKEEPDPFQKTAAAPAPLKAAAQPFWRVRYLTEQCLTQIQDATQFEPRLPAAPCNLEGESSPACIDALREWRQNQQVDFEQQRRDKPAAGFTTF